MADRRNEHEDAEAGERLLKPVDIKRAARVPYATVIQWIERGHARAGILPSVDLAEPGKRHSYRIRSEDWTVFQAKLRTIPKGTRQSAEPLPRPSTVKGKKGMFRF